MNPARPSRVRRVLKRAGLICCVLLLVAMAISFRWWIGYGSSRLASSQGGIVCILKSGVIDGNGCPIGLPLSSSYTLRRGFWVTDVVDDLFGFTPPEGWLSYLLRPRMQGAFPDSGYAVGFLRIPLAPPVIALAALTAFLWYRDRQVPPGYCRKCGYDLTGNISGICPECGTPIPQATLAASTQIPVNTG